MQYLITGIEAHPDNGFGITADAYFESAMHLMTSPFENFNVTQQAEMPQNFLFRHSIELYLKSLIIIFHKELKLPYGSVPYDSKEPEAFIDGQWRKLYTCHYIDKLYEYWLTQLFLPNLEQIQARAPKGAWGEAKQVTNLFSVIAKYDKDSAYFRYPITKNSPLDHEKYSMQKLNGKTIEEMVDEIKNNKSQTGKGGLTVLHFDDDENLVSAFDRRENILSDLREALKTVAEYFNGIHVMTRMTLCDNT